jgi:hypothetical protein|tara:strand:+ start:166 stop:375 length:210 start_codon:yes stop_codon:yes gene_type:complete
MLIFTSVNGATVNCSNGECKFSYSSHYEYARTNCPQTLNFENVETDYLHFTILETGKVCEVYESRKEEE